MTKKELILENARLKNDINLLVYEPKCKESSAIRKRVKKYYGNFTPILRFDTRPINENIYKL
jgi:hypothetical protein